MVEFTAPWEERIEEFHESKQAKYQGLADSWRESCWKTELFLVVICCRFSISISIENAGDISWREWKREAQVLGELHTEHPVWLWIRPSEPNWKPTYVVNGQHYQPRHHADVSSITGQNICWRMYLSTYKHENCSPNLVPVAKNPGSGSPPKTN